MSTLEQKKERVIVAAYIDKAQQQRLVEQARREDRSLSALVRRALANELEREAVR